MKPVDEMTLEEVLQEVYAGQYPDFDAVSGEWHANGPHGFRRRIDTLDAAAELPEGWHPEVTDCTTRGGRPLRPWIAEATNEDTRVVLQGYGPTELLARFRLRLAVLRATKKGASDEG